MQKKVKTRQEYRAIGVAGKRAKTALGYVPRCVNMYYHVRESFSMTSLNMKLENMNNHYRLRNIQAERPEPE